MDEASIIKFDDGSIEIYDQHELDNKTAFISKKSPGDGFKKLVSAIVEHLNMSDALSSIEQGQEYVIQIPQGFQDAFDSGEVLLNKSTKTGITWPILYKPLENGKREIVAQCPVVQKDIPFGFSLERIAGSLHRIQEQKQMNEMIELLQETLETVKRIEQGQMDDRIGLLNAGCMQIKVALDMTNETDRVIEIQNARSLLYTAHGQIFETIKSRVNGFEPVPNGKIRLLYRKVFTPSKLDKRISEYNTIQQYFYFYLKSSHMIGASFLITGEKAAAESFFNETKRNLELVGFDRLTTLNLINPDNKYILDEKAVSFVDLEESECIKDAKGYNDICVKVSGEDLLEAINNEREQEV